jgi:hypothetical protein
LVVDNWDALKAITSVAPLPPFAANPRFPASSRAVLESLVGRTMQPHVRGIRAKPGLQSVSLSNTLFASGNNARFQPRSRERVRPADLAERTNFPLNKT